MFLFSQARLEIKDLFTDLADGKLLMKLLEIISGENLGKPNKGLLRVQKVENLNRCLKFLSTKVNIYTCCRTEFKYSYFYHLNRICVFEIYSASI